jgi:hypothetical protein
MCSNIPRTSVTKLVCLPRKRRAILIKDIKPNRSILSVLLGTLIARPAILTPKYIVSATALM